MNETKKGPTRYPDRRAAFTSLELVVVLGLVLLLAATLVPMLARSRSNRLAFHCQNNNRQLCRAWRMYADDSRDRIVYSGDDGTGSSNPLNQYTWTLTHMDYSPSNPGNWDTNVDIVKGPLWPYTGGDASIYRCPADQSYVRDNTGVARPRVRSFSMNLYLGAFAGGCSGVSTICGYRIFLKTTDLVPSPARIFVFIDERWDAINWGNFYIDMAGYYPSNSTQYAFDQDLPGYVHDLGCSFSFGDGHSEIHRWRDPRTTPPPGSGFNFSNYPVPRDPDVAWLQDHATRPK